jgi:isopenicillin N synthase-like dioxygenase
MADLQTFRVPESVRESDAGLGREMINAWQAAGIFQVATTADQDRKAREAIESSKRFFQLPTQVKSSHVSDLTYSGYIGAGEEITAGETDHDEIFTVCKDIPLTDPRVTLRWPCHGPAPWPDEAYRRSMLAFMDELGGVGERLLRLTALGLGLKTIDALTELTRDGWHHMRVLRFPDRYEQSGHGIGSHTDYGLLVIAVQDDVGGLYVRPPVEGEKRNRNWLPNESTAGMYDNAEPWTYVKPVPSVLTVFPGDIMQFLTGGTLLSTPHKVELSRRERFSIAYFHEPNFNACVRPLADPLSDEYIHYGTHFTNMFTRCYPERVTTQRIHAEDRLSILARMREDAVAGA